MMRTLVKEESGVAEHPHVLEAAGDTAEVDFREPSLRLPFMHETRQDVVLFPVWFGLFFRQGYTEYLIGPRGKVLQDLFPRAAKKDRLKLTMDLIQAPIPQQLAVFIFHPVFLQEAKCWPKPAAIHELDYREQLFKFVLERRSREHKSIAALQLLNGPRRGRCPIAD